MGASWEVESETPVKGGEWEVESETPTARRELPEGVQPSTAGPGRSSGIGGAPAPEPRRGTMRGARPYAAPGEVEAPTTIEHENSGRRYDADPLINPQAVERLRSSFADMPEDRRLPYLRNLAAGGDAQARAARVLLSEVERENAAARDALRARPELANAPRRPAAPGGGGMPRGDVPVPDLAPTIGELAGDPALALDDRDPARLAAASAAQAGGRAMVAAESTPQALQQKATVKERMRAEKVASAPEWIYKDTAFDNAVGTFGLAAAKGLFQAVELGANALRLIPAGDTIDGALESAAGMANMAGELAQKAKSKASRDQFAEMEKVLKDPEANVATVIGFLMTNPGLVAELSIESGGVMVPMVAAGQLASTLAMKLARRAIGGAAKSPEVVAKMAEIAQQAASSGAIAANVAMGAGGAFDQALKNGSSKADAYNAAGMTAIGYALMARLTGGGAEAALAGGKPGTILGTAARETVQEGGESYSESIGAAATPEHAFDPAQATKQAVLEGGIGAVAGGGAGVISSGVGRFAELQAQRAQAENDALFDRYFAPPPAPGEPPPPPTKARAGSVARFDELAAAHGLDPEAAKAVKDEAGRTPADEVPGFLTRATRALNLRGLFAKPVEPESVSSLDAALSPPAETGATDETQATATQADAKAPAAESSVLTPGAAGEPINRNWTEFAEESGSLGIPRDQMPQVAAEHRGALVQFMAGKGIEHTTEEVRPQLLMPAQREFSPSKVQGARDFKGGDRAVLVSEDDYILDGTHQWLAKLEADEPVKIIRLAAPIEDLLRLTHQFPSSTTARGATPSSGAARAAGTQPAAERAPADTNAAPADTIPVGEATEMLPVGEVTEQPDEAIPTGEATEVPADKAVSKWLGAKEGKLRVKPKADERIPTGEVTEGAPEVAAEQPTEPIPVGEATETDETDETTAAGDTGDAGDIADRWDSLDYSRRQEIAQGAYSQRRVVHRLSGSKWADLSPGEQQSIRDAAAKLANTSLSPKEADNAAQEAPGAEQDGGGDTEAAPDETAPRPLTAAELSALNKRVAVLRKLLECVHGRKA